MKDHFGRYPATKQSLFSLSQQLKTICEAEDPAVKLYVRVRFSAKHGKTIDAAMKGVAVKPVKFWVSPLTGWFECLCELPFDAFDFSTSWEGGHRIFGEPEVDGVRPETDYVIAKFSNGAVAQLYQDMMWFVLDFRHDDEYDPVSFGCGDGMYEEFDRSIKTILDVESRIKECPEAAAIKADTSAFVKAFEEKYGIEMTTY